MERESADVGRDGDGALLRHPRASVIPAQAGIHAGHDRCSSWALAFARVTTQGIAGVHPGRFIWHEVGVLAT